MTGRVRTALATLGLLAVVVAPATAKPIKLHFPKFTVPPRSDREVCTFVRIPMKRRFDFNRIAITNVGVNPHFATHHFLVWAVKEGDLQAFEQFQGQVKDSTACIDFGPDSTSRILVGGNQQPKTKTRFPRGLAQSLPMVEDAGGQAVGFILNSHWINGSDEPQTASVRVTLQPAPKHSVRRFLMPIFEVTANAFIDVAPGSERTTGFDWSPGAFDVGGAAGGAIGAEPLPAGPACVTSVTAHMHQRGRLFTVDYLDGSGGAGERIFETDHYEDPGQRIFTTPLLVQVGQSLRYRCTHDNGVTRPVRMGCEEQSGVAPGKSILDLLRGGGGLFPGAARACDTDADCAGFGTGRCVPANLVFGFTSKDDMCILPGSYYDANAAAAPGHECELTGLPVLN